VTIHDLGYLRYPEAHTRRQRTYLRWSTSWNAHQSAHLLLDSETTKADLVARYRVRPEKMTVVYPGWDETLRPLTDAAALAAVRARYGLDRPYILHVGTLQPRKNLVRLVEAFACIRDGRVGLVLAGGKGWLYDELFATVETLGLSKEVIFPGYVMNDDLPLWYNAATTLAYPSLYEGFGMQVLEAQACGTPVLTSNVSSLPEAAGDAALMVHPRDVKALAAGLNRLLADEHLRRQLRAAGLAHARQFTWSRTARETARVYRRALARVPPLRFGGDGGGTKGGGT
ncbi:MAG: glycosyltransferase family 4 protein, partial [Anaerolineae bacterium]|nr:glycosyltransferase family 4 protein [Anaerolineae bacterium]